MTTSRVAAAALIIIAITSTLGAKPHCLVFPSGPTVPENLLRIELRFSAPLYTALDIQYVHLYDDHGREMPNALLDLPLPSADGREVTILLDPARVKSGVGANLALGRCLHSGQFVTIVVEDPSLAETASKTWLVAGIDTIAPQPCRWVIVSPSPGTRSPLLVRLDATLGLSAERWIAICGPDGSRVNGQASLRCHESVWEFQPAEKWQEGSYVLDIRSEIEDVAGNRLGAPFEAVRGSSTRLPVDFERPFWILRSGS